MVETETLAERALRQAEERKAQLQHRMDEAPRAPSVPALFLELPLYAPVQLNPKRDDEWLKSIRFGALQFDAHCVQCGQRSTFHTVNDRAPQDVKLAQQAAAYNNPAKVRLRNLTYESGQFGVHFACMRRGHIYSYFFTFDEGQALLTKIGQDPSLEDVAGADIEKYRKILGGDFSELRKAGGLIAHGIGIGAFVYLRRIFERLVEDARKEVDPTDEHRADFYQLRMAERVTALKSVLPAAVVEYRESYGILSKGLHELSEEECKKHFPVVRAAIIAMLEERYEAAEKRRAADDLKAAVHAAAQEVK